MQLRLGLALVALAALAGPAAADGELQLRGAYFKEKATRVQQPMLDGRFDAGEHGSIDGHVLVDAITSASTASSAEDAAFSETRLEAGGGYTHTAGIYKLAAAARYSTEPDYKSRFGTVRGEAELFQRNLRVGVAASAGHDDVYMINEYKGKLLSYLGSVSVAQIVSRNAIASMTYDVSYLEGYQSNPYRQVSAGGTLVSERHPMRRLRHAIAASGRYFREPTSTTVIGAYRLYHDDWGVLAHTPELRVIQDVGETVQVALRYRYYWQNAADFYQDTYLSSDPVAFPYLTDDQKLSKFTGHTVAVKFGVTGATLGLEDRLGTVQGELLIEYNVQGTDFGNAGVAHAALTIPFEY